ncbi:replication protein A 32 kDa subunit-A-like [Ostrea edulis]|uniref:replication protein A 32 kDa subunit-A-like n=1 Tax=Ostrea edulis TaxID=37623 RepID=UPI0024AE9691|nr:replication protein A 32 kDa subunit-A-like [Ostrea edulis]
MWNQGGYQDQGQGGFSSPGGFGTPQGTQGDRKSRNRAQNILPCTTAEILSANQNDDKFYSGEIELSQITIVGLIIAVKESPTRIDYEVDDMTGPPLEVKQFVDNDESVPETERIAALRENTYVRVYGTVRSFGGKRNVTAFKMVPVMDMNEVTYHMLEVTHSHLALSKQSMSSGAPMNKTAADDIYSNQDSGMVSGLNQVQNQVHSIIQSNMSDEGASIENVCKQLGGVPERSVREAVEFLSSEGHIYSTIDEDHYKATDS